METASSSEDHKIKRIEGLEELQRRIASNSIQRKNEAIGILLDMAKKWGGSLPESSLIIESFTLFIKKYEDVFQIVLNGLGGREERLFICFSKAVLSLDYNKKRQAIESLIGFLMSRDALNSTGVKEVYDCLVSLGNEKLSKEIVKETSLYLDSFKICAIIFSVRICSKFADQKLLPSMLKVLEKSMKGYFDGHSTEVEREICQFLERVRDPQSLPLLMKLIKRVRDQQFLHISKAIACVLDTNPSRVDDVLDMLYDERDVNVIDAILQSLENMNKTKIDPQKLLSKIHINWWDTYPINYTMQRLLVKWDELSKPALFEILQQDETYDFALQCLKEIGLSKEEISEIFPKPLMLQVYNFFYGKGKKIPKNLNQIWDEKEKLHETVPGEKPDRLEHLLLHIFSSFNFVTMNIVHLNIEGVDIVCFDHETLDLFVIGSTTGILKDDMQKMDALVKEMKAKMTELLDKCSVTPIVVSSTMASITPSDAQYAAENNIVIMQRRHIDTLLEMLNNNRQSREVIKYIKDLSFQARAALA